VCQFTEYSGTQASIWPSVYINIQERKLAVQLCQHGEITVGTYAMEVFL
jgi:hypothetical protein